MAVRHLYVWERFYLQTFPDLATFAVKLISLGWTTKINTNVNVNVIKMKDNVRACGKITVNSYSNAWGIEKPGRKSFRHATSFCLVRSAEILLQSVQTAHDFRSLTKCALGSQQASAWRRLRYHQRYEQQNQLRNPTQDHYWQLKSKAIFRRPKIKFYKSVIIPVYMYNI